MKVSGAIRDAQGEPLRVGDCVRVVGLPDLSDLVAPMKGESSLVFGHLLGTVRRVREFDELGNVVLTFTIRKGQAKGLHCVGIEPFLLRRQVPRASKI